MKGILGNLMGRRVEVAGSAEHTAYLRALQSDLKALGARLNGFAGVFESVAKLAGERAGRVEALANAIPAEATAEEVDQAAAEIAELLRPVREIVERLESVRPMLDACNGCVGKGRPGVSFRGIEGGAAAWMQRGRQEKR